VKSGLLMTVHQPERVMSACGLNDVISRPIVGTVQTVAIRIAMAVANGEVVARVGSCRRLRFGCSKLRLSVGGMTSALI